MVTLRPDVYVPPDGEMEGAAGVLVAPVAGATKNAKSVIVLRISCDVWFTPRWSDFERPVSCFATGETAMLSWVFVTRCLDMRRFVPAWHPDHGSLTLSVKKARIRVSAELDELLLKAYSANTAETLVLVRVFASQRAYVKTFERNVGR